MTADKDSPRKTSSAHTVVGASEPMEHPTVHFGIESAAPESHKADIMVVGAFSDGTLTAGGQAIDSATKGRLASLIKSGELDPNPGSTETLLDLAGVEAERVILVSLGKREELGEKTFLKGLEGAAKALASANAKNAAVTLADVEVPKHSEAWRVQNATRILADGLYKFNVPHADGNGNGAAKGPSSISLLMNARKTSDLNDALRRGQAVAEGMALTKDLGNLPGNVCNPTFLANTAKSLGKEFGFDVEILDRDDMEKLGMNSALSVGQASDQPCKFIVMQYKGGNTNAKPIVLVGKGVTFDTGGVSLKPGDDMDMMKYDMSGAGSVFGVMKTVARLKLPLNVVGIVGAVENMPGGNATRPGDVVRSMSGITIEILNTDAEGRLVLCDALTYAERFKPEYVIDVATLTGACVVALGLQTTGLFANDDTLAAELYECGTDTGDRAWQLPVWDEYFEQLKSNFADTSNIGGRPAGSITAACFLSRFANGYKWAHLDIAGTASVGGAAKGATGRPVPLLSEFLLRHADRMEGKYVRQH